MQTIVQMQPWEPSGHVEGAGGAQLAVYDGGTAAGRPLLFVHGIGQAALCWSKQFSSPLCDEFRLVAFDLRGHGRSSRPATGYGDSTAWAHDLKAVIDGLSLERPIVIAWSYGGLVACDYLRAFGDSGLAGVLFVSGATRIGTDGALADLPPGGLDSADVGTWLLRLTAQPLPFSEHCLWLGMNVLVGPDVRGPMLDRVLENDDVLAAIGRPVLLLHGAEDASLLPSASRRVAAILPGAGLEVWEGVGHSAFWEDADRFGATVRRFARHCWT